MKKHDVNIVVLNVFLEKTKKTRHYLKVFCTFCHPLGIERILRLFHAPAQYLEMSSASPFKRCKCFNDIIDALDNVKFEFAHRTNSTKFVETDLDIQEQVIYATNTLLHHTIGSKNVDGREVAEIGQGIFNESCRRILGDDFKDVTESPQGVLNS